MFLVSLHHGECQFHGKGIKVQTRTGLNLNLISKCRMFSFVYFKRDLQIALKSRLCRYNEES